MSYLKDEDALSLSINGLFCFKATANATTTKDMTFTEDCVLTGFLYDAYNFNIGDKLTAQVVHPSYGVLKEFAKDWFITRGPVLLDVYAFRPKTGLILRAIYTSVGPLECDFILNGIRHKETLA